MTGILLRVFNRIDDLIICVETIRKYWRNDTYYIVVVSNGKTEGFPIPDRVKTQVDRVMELEKNIGHRQGNSQLILAGISQIPASCRYTVLLEADTWVFTDELVLQYIRQLDAEKAVWASAEWVEKYWSLGLDFAIVQTAYMQQHPAMFDFTVHAESWVCNYLMDYGQKFKYIKENMPVHRPKSIAWLHNAYGGRFRMFPNAKMVTHHIEDLEHGIETKKLMANICLNHQEFPVGKEDFIRREYRKMCVLMSLSRYLPRSRWFRKKQKRTF